jgi:hypothetical protein
MRIGAAAAGADAIDSAIDDWNSRSEAFRCGARTGATATGWNGGDVA